MWIVVVPMLVWVTAFQRGASTGALLASLSDMELLAPRWRQGHAAVGVDLPAADRRRVGCRGVKG